jgi:ketosteroid isomerase-like protein
MGDAVLLQAVVLDQQGRLMGRRPQWSSSNPAVAQVEADGRLLALTAGRATISAEAEGRRAQTDVTVTTIVAAVDVTPATAGLQVGQALVLVGTARGPDGRTLPDRSVTWRSSNEAVVVVSTTGHVTAVGAGTAVVSATSEGQVGSAEITVAAPPAAQAEAPPAPAPPPVVAEDPSAAIGEVVRSYAQALQARDMARVKALYPEIPSAAEQQTREAVQAMAELRVSLAASNIAVSGTTARARVTGAWVYRGGRLDVNNTYLFERRSDRWVIVGIN